MTNISNSYGINETSTSFILNNFSEDNVNSTLDLSKIQVTLEEK